MLGSNLGKKVTAGIVQEKYKQFLKNKPEEKQKQLTPEERKQAKRAEMRKRGIFVKADDPDETPTIMEKIDGPSQPMIYILPEKPTVWKTSKKKGGAKKNKSRKGRKHSEKSPKTDLSISAGPQKKKAKKEKKASNVVNSLPSSSSSTTENDQSIPVSKRKKSAEKSRKSAESDVDPKSVAKPKLSSKEQIQEKKIEGVKSEEKVSEKIPEGVSKEADQKSEKEEKSGEVGKVPSIPTLDQKDALKSPTTAIPNPPTTDEKGPNENPLSKTDSDAKIGSENTTISSTSSNPSLVDSQKKNISAPIAESQPNAFDKLDDDEFEKMTSDADEKEMLKLAPRLLKVAKKHAAIEKCLTPAENEVLAKFSPENRNWMQLFWPFWIRHWINNRLFAEE
uniref:Glutamic acid-rich protein-like n=1 Tax=Caenorhabditis tropicalis TaxID=1561998 RepID=A0A1I7V1I2_9PELO